MKIWIATLVVDGYGADHYASDSKFGVERKLADELRALLVGDEFLGVRIVGTPAAVIDAYCEANDGASCYVSEVDVELPELSWRS